MKLFVPLRAVSAPPTAWTKAVRTALGMTLLQLAKRLSITKQSAQELEKREAEGSITIQSLRAAAQALDMVLVYGFVPKDGSLDKLLERKARSLATTVVARTSNTMKLEGQENSKKRLEAAIQERTALLKLEMPKALWD